MTFSDLLARPLPGSKTFSYADIGWVLLSGTIIHFAATTVFWLPAVLAGCARL